MRLLLSGLRVFLSLCLVSQSLYAAGAPRSGGSRFSAAHSAALEEVARQFVSAGDFDPEAAVAPLAGLAETDADKALLEKFKAVVKEAAALREPVAAKAGPAKEGEEPDILDARYKGRLMALASKVGADGRKAADVRRELLRKAAPLGPDGKPAAGNPGQPPTPEEQAAIRRMEARAGRGSSAATMGSARRIAAAMDRFAAPENLPAGATPASAGAARPPADAKEAELIGVANTAFKGGPTTLATHAPQAPGAAHPPAEKGWWTRFRDATTIDSVQHAFEKHNKEGMAAAAATEDRSAAQFAKGEWVKGSGNAVLAWGQRLWAGDAETVKQAAIGAGVAVAAVVAAPIVLPAAGAAALTGTAAAAVGVKAALLGVTTFSVVNGAGHFAHKPDLVNGVLLAANVVAAPGLGKASEFIVGKAAGLAAGRSAAETTGAVALSAALPEVAAAAGTTARVATATTARAATGTAVEAAAATESAVVQVAVRTAPTAENVAVHAVEGVAHNALHVTADKVVAVDPKHH